MSRNTKNTKTKKYSYICYTIETIGNAQTKLTKNLFSSKKVNLVDYLLQECVKVKFSVLNKPFEEYTVSDSLSISQKTCAHTIDLEYFKDGNGLFQGVIKYGNYHTSDTSLYTKEAIETNETYETIKRQILCDKTDCNTVFFVFFISATKLINIIRENVGRSFFKQLSN